VLNKLGQVLPVTNSLTSCLTTHVLPILGSVVPDGSLSSGRPVWQDFVHFLPGVVSTAQSFDGNGYWIRLMLGAGTNTISLGNTALGKIVGDTPSNSPIMGARPVWQGDLPATAFQPGVPCSSDRLPSLASTNGPSDAQITGAATPATPITATQLRSKLTVAIRRAAR
jgi:hypothetical protein